MANDRPLLTPLDGLAIIDGCGCSMLLLLLLHLPLLLHANCRQPKRCAKVKRGEMAWPN